MYLQPKFSEKLKNCKDKKEVIFVHLASQDGLVKDLANNILRLSYIVAHNKEGLQDIVDH